MNTLFELPSRSGKADVLKLVKETKKVKPQKTMIMNTMEQIRQKVMGAIGKYRHKYKLVIDEQELINYVDICIKNGIVSIDNETTGLDEMRDDIVGFSLKTPNQPAIYVPINHISIFTKQRLSEQLDVKFAVEQFKRLDVCKQIYQDSSFDVRIQKHNLNVDFYYSIYWDTLTAAVLLNENEPHNLKYLYNKYCLGEETEDEIFKYNTLFGKTNFAEIPLDIAYIYGARDAKMTFELYEFQKQFLGETVVPIGHQYYGLSWNFHNVEIPIIPVTCEMEDNGISIDEQFANDLTIKYRELLGEAQNNFYNELKPYEKRIANYNARNPGRGLPPTINYASPQQMAILLYDILKVTPSDKKKLRGTGEEILEKIDLPFCKAILECRGYEKLLGTYIEKLPKVVNEKTGRLHCNFNPSGTETGRYSSSNPNLQNIPSKNEEIRKMFIPGMGNVFLSSDFSQQEPRILSFLSNDENLKEAYKEGKDLYAWVASLVYKVPYEDCMEFYLDKNGKKTEKVNPEGKQRRKKLKAIVLGIAYSKGAKAISEDLNISEKEAQNIYDLFFKTFPNVKKFIDDTQEFAKQYGYVETIWGRKRRLPDLLLEKYNITYNDNVVDDFNPLDFSGCESSNEVDYKTKQYFIKKLENCWSKKLRDNIKKEAESSGIVIIDNTMKIINAERQCVNSRVQGSAATQTKLSMIYLLHKTRNTNNGEFRKLGGKLVIPLHDELFTEVSYENRTRCGEILRSTMVNCIDKWVDVPFVCDVEITDRWNGESLK